MRTLQRKYIPTGAVEPEKAPKQAWSVSDYVFAGLGANTGDFGALYGFDPAAKIVQFGNTQLAEQINELNTIIIKNAQSFGTLKESTGISGDLTRFVGIVLDRL